MSSHGRRQASRRDSDSRKTSTSSSLKSHHRSRRHSTSSSDGSTSSSGAERARSRRRSQHDTTKGSRHLATSSTVPLAKKRKRRHRSSSSDSSDDSSAKRSKKCKAKKKKKKRKHKKDKKSKIDDPIVLTKVTPNVGDASSAVKAAVSEDELIGPAAASMNTKSMKPMSKEEWEKKQSIIRKVYDPETGRHRLIRGDGEVLEEIVSHQQHKDINKKSTEADGSQFQSKLGLKN